MFSVSLLLTCLFLLTQPFTTVLVLGSGNELFRHDPTTGDFMCSSKSACVNGLGDPLSDCLNGYCFTLMTPERYALEQQDKHQHQRCPCAEPCSLQCARGHKKSVSQLAAISTAKLRGFMDYIEPTVNQAQVNTVSDDTDFENDLDTSASVDSAAGKDQCACMNNVCTCVKYDWVKHAIQGYTCTLAQHCLDRFRVGIWTCFNGNCWRKVTIISQTTRTWT